MRISGRGEKIRTSDPLHPMQVRYQAALRPDKLTIIRPEPVVVNSAFHSAPHPWAVSRRVRQALHQVAQTILANDAGVGGEHSGHQAPAQLQPAILPVEQAAADIGTVLVGHL